MCFVFEKSLKLPTSWSGGNCSRIHFQGITKFSLKKDVSVGVACRGGFKAGGRTGRKGYTDDTSREQVFQEDAEEADQTHTDGSEGPEGAQRWNHSCFGVRGGAGKFFCFLIKPQNPIWYFVIVLELGQAQWPNWPEICGCLFVR